MDANLILIDDDTELARARALVETLWDSEAPADVARWRAQALLIAAYEESRWPSWPPKPRRTHPPSHGSTRPVPRRYGPVSRHAEPRERGVERQEGPQPDDGATATRALLRSGGLAVAFTRNDKKPRRSRARRGVSARLPAFLRSPAFPARARPRALRADSVALSRRVRDPMASLSFERANHGQTLGERVG